MSRERCPAWMSARPADQAIGLYTSMSAIAVMAYITPKPMVMRSRFFSMIPVPVEVAGMAPPSIVDRPVPFPECSSTKITRPMALMTCSAMTMYAIACTAGSFWFERPQA
ncbi:hypothetical protein emb_1c0052 [Coriobacteriaceae bacterium EMTCatB1]|nr:hypothetical protein emb_1c0052 [Coriobacteriaceae bacterium EMTCatB1]